MEKINIMSGIWSKSRHKENLKKSENPKDFQEMQLYQIRGRHITMVKHFTAEYFIFKKQWPSVFTASKPKLTFSIP